MIAVCDTSACTSGLKLHAGVSFSAIMKPLSPPNRARETSNRTWSAQRPRNHPEWLLKVTDDDKA
jgi:hypothetical protein